MDKPMNDEERLTKHYEQRIKREIAALVPVPYGKVVLTFEFNCSGLRVNSMKVKKYIEDEERHGA